MPKSGKRKTRTKKTGPGRAPQAEKKPVNYKMFFIVGILWTLIGAAAGAWGFFAIGIVFAIMGMANRDKWKNESCRLDRRGFIAVIIAILAAVLLAAALRYF